MPPLIHNKRILITGGAGFIGSALAGRLVDDNEVVVYDNFRHDALSRKPYAAHANLQVIRGDVLDAPALVAAMAGAQLVVHCAAIAGVDAVLESPTETIRVNMMGTAHALQAAQQLDGLERFVNLSSSEVYGTHAYRCEETQPAQIGPAHEPRWGYAASKLAGEHLARAYRDEHGMPTVTVRPCNVYGPDETAPHALTKFVAAAIKNDPIEVHGDGLQVRAWCHLDDFLDGLLLAMTLPAAVGETFNLGNPRTAVTILGLAESVVRLLDSRSTIRFVAKDYPDVELRVPDVRNARERLGFEPAIGLEAGIRRISEVPGETVRLRPPTRGMTPSMPTVYLDTPE